MDVIRMILGELKNMVLPCLISLPIIIFIRYLTYRKTKEFNLKREVLTVLFWMYITALLSVTFIPERSNNEPFNAPLFHLPDFSDKNTVTFENPIGWTIWKINLGEWAEIVRNIAGNILVFIPYGFLVPIIWKKLKAKTILFGFLLSFFIEFSQLFMERQSDVYDLILNTLGVAIGYLIYTIARKIKKSKYQSWCDNEG